MADFFVALLVAIVGVVLVAAVIYIGGFLVSIVASLFTAPYETVKHHHDHPMTI